MSFTMEVGKQLHGRGGRLRRKSARKPKVPEKEGVDHRQYPQEKDSELRAGRPCRAMLRSPDL